METRHISIATIARPVAPEGQATTKRPVEKPIEFILNLPTAQSVGVAGTFNNWDPKRTPLRKEAEGGWKTTVWLPRGRYEYRFVVDGQWINDPNAKESVNNPFGSTNSVVLVG
jgi:1,4-alpha-glucan branching enzyme